MTHLQQPAHLTIAKRITMTLLFLCGSLPLLYAQTAAELEADFGMEKEWYHGDKMYRSHVKGNTITFVGEDFRGLAYRFIIRTTGKNRHFVLTQATDNAINANVGTSVVLYSDYETRQTLLIFRDKKKRLTDMLLENSYADDLRDAMTDLMKRMINGHYTNPATGDSWAFEYDGTCTINLQGNSFASTYVLSDDNGGTPCCITINNFNGEGARKFMPKPTEEGLNLLDMDNLPNSFDLTMDLSKADRSRYEPLYSSRPITPFVTDYFLGGPYDWLYVKNEIYARQGYQFKDKNWRETFSSKPWYKPAASNNQVELTPIQMLNVEYLKYRIDTYTP